MKKKNRILVFSLISMGFLLLISISCKKEKSAQIPVLSTTEASNITSTTALSGGSITDDGGATVTSRGVCWSSTHSPTIANSSTSVGSGIGNFTVNLEGLSPNTIHYLRAYATNSAGTGYGNEITFSTIALALGDHYQGGIVAYILQDGDPGFIEGETHGLIASSADLSTGIKWNNGSDILTGASGTALGTGSSNTSTIIASQGNSGAYAAKLCSDYAGGSYHDWFLPSSDELNLLFENRTIIGGFTNQNYWGSTEFDNYYACVQFFGDGGFQGNNYKTTENNVRAIRNF